MNPKSTLPIAACIAALSSTLPAAPPHTTYLWHLHQPIYWNDQRAAAPDHYEAAWDTIQAQGGGRPHPSDSLSTIFGLDDRKAAYQYRPRDAVQDILFSADAGVQLNMSGALMENVASLAGNFDGYNPGWEGSFIQARQWSTTGGKPRMDIVNFTYHHSLAPLHTQKTFEMELRLHRRMMELKWGTSPALSRGYFPTEMAFSERLIPTLRQLGVEWSVVSGEHLSRACADFPLVLGTGGVNCEPPNQADILNPAQGSYNRVQISRGCSPCTAVPFGYTPQRAHYVDPVTGAIDTLVVVPAAQEYSWLDGYGSFSPSQMDAVKAGNDASRPELLLLAHDGDNAWGGGYSYYRESVNNFVGQTDAAGYKASTVEQYLSQFPVPANPIVKVENGGWVNADSDFGSPSYINWLYPLLNASGQPDPVNGWHEKAREYAMFIACENRVRTAEQVSGVAVRLDKILNPDASATAVERAWHYYLGSLDSGNVYYGTPGDMEVRSTVGANQAFARADSVLAGAFTDNTEPSVFIPQRWPYNPGAVNFGVATGYQQKVIGPDFAVWTFAYDASGIANATLYYRNDLDGARQVVSVENDTYAGGPGVGAWKTLDMNGRAYPKGNVYNKPELDYSYALPTHIANHYSATVTGETNTLIDYFVQVTDSQGNVARTPIQHVWVADGSGGGGGGNGSVRVAIIPSPPTAGQPVTVQYAPEDGPIAAASAVTMHWGANGWAAGTVADAAMTSNPSSARWETTVTLPAAATQFDLVFNNGAGTWDNNSGADWHFPVQPGTPPPPVPWTIDGVAETEAYVRAQNPSGLKLWIAHQGNTLYVATQGAANSRDHFIYVTRSLSQTQAANWSKAGTIVQWDAFLANESTNNFNGWFDAAQGQTLGAMTEKASGGASGVLEGAINLDALYAPMPAAGAAVRAPVPSTVYVAAVEYATNDGGALVASTQAPATTNGDGNLDATEFFAYSPASSVAD